jgi:hypothetical protein
VLWIRAGFNADPDPAIYLNADPGPESQQMRIQADQDPDQTFESQQVEFLHSLFKDGKRSKNITTKIQMPF